MYQLAPFHYPSLENATVLDITQNQHMTPLNLAHSPRMERFLNQVVPSSAMVPNTHCYNISRTGTAPTMGKVVQTVTIHLYSYLKTNKQNKTKKSIVNRYRPV